MTEEQKKELAEIRAQLDGGAAQESLQKIEALQSAVEGPDAAEVFYLRGVAQAALGAKSDAEQSFMTAYSIVRFGRNADARRLLGKTAEQLGQKDEALAAYRDVLAEVPDDAEATAALKRLQSA